MPHHSTNSSASLGWESPYRRPSRSAVQKFVFFCLLFLALVGLVSPFSYNVLPAGSLVEGVLFIAALLVMRVPKRPVVPFFAIAALYVSMSLMLMLARGTSNILDFAQAYKAFIYVLPLSFFVARPLFSVQDSVRVLKVLLVLFLIKYGYSVALNLDPRMGSRPGILVENNFELIFLIIGFFLLHPYMGARRHAWFVLLAALVALSGSRSSLLALLVLFCGMYLQRLTLKTFFYAVAFAVLTIGAAMIFMDRADGGGLESIDRYRFMLIFLTEVSGWPMWQFLVGSYPITPLSDSSCSALAYYENLFSFSGDGSCYSVILHSYFLRVIFDQGILGLGFLLWFYFAMMRYVGLSKFQAAIIIGIICASALSVSAMNTVFVALAMAWVFGLDRRGLTERQ